MTRTLLSVNNYYYPRGGAEMVFMRHNGIFSNAGWSVVPFSMQHEKNEPSEWSGGFVEEIEFGRENESFAQRARKGLKAVYSLEARRKIRGLIDRTHPNVCHVHNIYHHISPSILSVLRRREIPVVMTLHALKIACPAYLMLSQDGVCERCRDGRLFQVATNRCMKGDTMLSMLVMVESYLHRMLRSYVGNVDCFVVSSRFYLEKLSEWGFDAGRFEYVPNFVDARAFDPCFVPGRRFVYSGRLSREKGIVTLIRAAAEAEVGVDIIGTGPLEAELHELVHALGADVRFHGFLSGKALSETVAAARAVVVPSEWYENAPLSVLEAYALGKPVIAADIGGLPELVVDGRTGWIFESGSIESLATCLRAVADMADRRVGSAGAVAREYVVDEFSPDRYRNTMTDLYARLGAS
jgi:glycosyltransferase involved in cell wall biosynthesis